MELLKRQHGAGGYVFSITSKKGNTRLGAAKKLAIIEALQDSWTDEVYQTSYGEIKRQLLNGVSESLKKDGNGGYVFVSF